MTNKTKIAMIALMIALAFIGTVAASETCTVPPDEYFLVDGPMNGQPVHDGAQLGYVWYVTADQRIQSFSGSHFLGINRGEYKMRISHLEQEQIAFARMFYCASLPDFPYEAPETFTSEDPNQSTYENAHSSAIFR